MLRSLCLLALKIEREQALTQACCTPSSGTKRLEQVLHSLAQLGDVALDDGLVS